MIQTIELALNYIGIAIDNVDKFGRSAHFKWGNGKDVIEAIEHKEVMKVLLYWQREVQIYEELYIGGKKDEINKD